MIRSPLAEDLSPKYELVLLSDAVHWSEIERSFSVHFARTTDSQALLLPLVAGLLYLLHAYECSDAIDANTSV